MKLLVAVEGNESVSDGEAFELQLSGSGGNSIDASIHNSIDRRTSVSENLLVKNLGGISFSITADSARNNVYNIDNGDGIVVRIISLLGAFVAAGHLKFGAHTPSNMTSSILGNGLHDGGGTMFDDKLSLLLFALQKALHAAPRRLMTTNVYMALLAASDLAFLACSHPENRGRLTSMEEWPEWILEVLISNHERGSSSYTHGANIGDIEDLIHNFLIIMLEHSMHQKDGWKDVEATIHCAEWLSSTGDQRMRGGFGFICKYKDLTVVSVSATGRGQVVYFEADLLRKKLQGRVAPD
ncbi:hypothetical protein IFM89_030954 [Coptis chinensis]|uniref:DUF4704 domain-containing protein n=1 Tax=Coptis chinensis TaxID=261450 RepID=A0A835MDW6_9MAGN|nr:hypothetical protein IFM89_030954 [Coptis chinensis]